MLKKTIYIFLVFLLVTSCGGTFDSVKRGLTGSKANTADEFLVKKKDPLILPPDFENLPIPDEDVTDIAENTIFENTLETAIEENTSTSEDSVEKSILRKIQSK